MSALADQAEDFLAARTWDATARRWIARPAGAPVVLEAPATTSTPAELFARAYRDEEARELAALLEAGIMRDEAASQRWLARAAEGWTRDEIAAVLVGLVDGRLLRELAARFEGLQAWGPIAPPRQPRPGARRLLEGCAWTGETWAPSTEGELWPVPPINEWIRLRCTPETRPGKPPTRAHKAFKWTGEKWDKAQETPGGRFIAEPVIVADDVEAWAEFFEAARADRGAFMVRGVLGCNPDRRGQVRRAKLADKGAWIGEHPIGRRVMLLDIDDKLPVREVWPEWPGFDRVPTEAELAELVRRTLRWALPEAFHNAACAVAFSASAGVPGGGRGATGWCELRVHIVIVCDRPFSDEPFRAWLNEHVRKVEVTDKAGKKTIKPVIDTAPADPIQFMYVADPTFEGAPSPWPAHLPRVMVLDGVREVVTLAELVDGATWREGRAADDVLRELSAALEEVAAAGDAMARASERTAAATPTGGSLQTLGARVREAEEKRTAKRIASWCADVLTGACAVIAGDPHHEGLRRAALRAYWAVAPGLLDEGEARTAIFDAWIMAGSRDGETAKTRRGEAERALNFAAKKSAKDRTTLDKVRDYLAAHDDEEAAR